MLTNFSWIRPSVCNTRTCSSLSSSVSCCEYHIQNHLSNCSITNVKAVPISSLGIFLLRKQYYISIIITLLLTIKLTSQAFALKNSCSLSCNFNVKCALFHVFIISRITLDFFGLTQVNMLEIIVLWDFCLLLLSVTFEYEYIFKPTLFDSVFQKNAVVCSFLSNKTNKGNNTSDCSFKSTLNIFCQMK